MRKESIRAFATTLMFCLLVVAVLSEVVLYARLNALSGKLSDIMTECVTIETGEVISLEECDGTVIVEICADTDGGVVKATVREGLQSVSVRAGDRVLFSLNMARTVAEVLAIFMEE